MCGLTGAKEKGRKKTRREKERERERRGVGGRERRFLFVLFFFLQLHPRHMDVPRLQVESELQLPAYTTATAKPDLSQVCNLHHSSRQCQILNPWIEARDQTCILMDTSRVHYR